MQNAGSSFIENKKSLFWFLEPLCEGGTIQILKRDSSYLIPEHYGALLPLGSTEVSLFFPRLAGDGCSNVLPISISHNVFYRYKDDIHKHAVHFNDDYLTSIQICAW
jgi:hypothetical protein